MFGRATIRLGIGPHSSYFCFARECCQTNTDALDENQTGRGRYNVNCDCYDTLHIRHRPNSTDGYSFAYIESAASCKS